MMNKSLMLFCYRARYFIILLVLLTIKNLSISAEPVTIAFTEFKTTETVSNTMGSLIPNHLKNSLIQLFALSSKRYTGKDETNLIEVKKNIAQEEALRLAIKNAISSRDIKALTIRSASLRSYELINAELNIIKAQNKLKAFLAGKKTDLNVTESIQDIMLWKGNTSLLPDLIDSDRKNICAKEKIDFLVSGELDYISSIFILSLKMYSSIQNKDIWYYENYASSDSLEEMLQESANTLSKAVYGKPYSILSFNLSPEETKVFINGERNNTLSMLFFDTNYVTLDFEAKSYYPETVKIITDPDKNRDLDIKLKPFPAVDIMVNSEPGGAQVFVDGNLSGLTPLVLSSMASPKILRFSLDGYESRQVVFASDSKLDMQKIVLNKKEAMSFNDGFELKKSSFYNSLGFFIISLPFTVLSGGLFQTYYNTINNSGGIISDTSYRHLEGSFYFYQSVFWISTAITLGCAVNSGINLARYISFVQR